MMKLFTSILAVNIFIVFGSFAQNTNAENHEPCITLEQYEVLEKQLAESHKMFPVNARNGKVEVVALEWPVKATSNLHDCSFYRVAAYVDHDPAAGPIKDFSGGTNTYDGHRGTDIATWPFNFIKMDNDLVEVVAAAGGTIAAVHDGEFDRNCGSNNLTANYIMITHSDGSTALYWHMKKNSVTTKKVGDKVVVGEKLGVVGSSGSASGPHLHFEVWSGNDVSTRIDPFYGTSNVLNNVAWWANQKPVKETEIVKAYVAITDAIFPACPTTETSNESTAFVTPFQGPGMTAGYAKFYIFIRDEVNGLVGNMSILNPDNSAFASWTYTSSSNTGSRTFAWSKKIPTVPGKYTFKADYNGKVCSSTFDIVLPTGIENLENVNGISIYPNPSTGKFTVFSTIENAPILTVFNPMGEKVFESNLTDSQTEIQIESGKGIYYYQLKNTLTIVDTGKLMVE